MSAFKVGDKVRFIGDLNTIGEITGINPASSTPYYVRVDGIHYYFAESCLVPSSIGESSIGETVVPLFAPLWGGPKPEVPPEAPCRGCGRKNDVGVHVCWCCGGTP